MSGRDCEQVRALAPELALGIASGDERATALRHVAECAECRRHVEELSTLGDELLLLAPTKEPPVGFETRVLERAQPPAPRRRRLVPVAAAAAAAAALTSAAMWLGFRDDRDVASRYRDTLAVANGKYFTASKLTAPGGDWAGYVYGYEGEPSWVLVVVKLDQGPREARYDVQLIPDSGKRVLLRPLTVSASEGSAGQTIPIEFHRVAEVRLLGPERGQVLEASFRSRD